MRLLTTVLVLMWNVKMCRVLTVSLLYCVHCVVLMVFWDGSQWFTMVTNGMKFESSKERSRYHHLSNVTFLSCHCIWVIRHNFHFLLKCQFFPLLSFVYFQLSLSFVSILVLCIIILNIKSVCYLAAESVSVCGTKNPKKRIDCFFPFLPGAIRWR